jgi:hypothetical protein
MKFCALPIFFTAWFAADGAVWSGLVSNGWIGLGVGVLVFIALCRGVDLLARRVAGSISKESFKPSCASKAAPVKCIRVRPSINRYSFCFEDEKYARDFAALNHTEKAVFGP